MKASCKLILSILGYCLTLIQIISAIDVIPNSYIIEFNGSPNNQSVSSFESSAKNDGINYKFRETFNQIVFNGVSIKLENDRDISKIKKLKEVKNVWPVAKIQRTEFKIEEDNSSTSQNFRSSIGFIEENEQPKVNSSEIKVGIIDTGIDYNHPALGGCFKTEGCKVQFGFDFVGDDFDGSNDPNPDDDPLDECVGHGTHAAGIIAGEDSANNITGIAPNVKLGAYRIFGCNGGTTNDLVIKAMGQAFEDGMNIINLSLVSGDNAWFGGPESLAAEKLTENGIFVVVPAGSSGDKGIFKVSSPSTAPGVISVASFDTEQINSFFIQPSCDPTRKIQYLTQDEKAVQLQNSFSITPTSNVTNSVNDACETINEDLTGIIALVRRGGCDDTTKINIIQAAGASAIILYNNASGIALSEFDQNGVTIPVAMISCEDGVFLFNRIQENNSLTIQFSNETVLINNPSTLKVSEFSSFGPTYEMEIKPDIAAPGNNILSAFPISLGSFKSLSGSSVSAPFITGALALYIQNKEESPPELVRNVIQNNAIPFTINIEEDSSLVATTILQQGAGLVNLANALSSTVVTYPTKLALNDSAHFNGKYSKITLTNIGKETTKFTFNHLPAQSINGFDGINVVPADSPIIKNSFANVKFSIPSIRLRPGESRNIALTFTPPKDEGDSDNSLYSGYIVITDSLTKKNSYVSYMGMKGCMNTLPIFDDQSGAPFIQSGANDLRLTSPDDVLTVSMKGDDIVLLGVRMALGTRIFTVDVIPDESAAPAEPTETQPTETEQPTETQTGAPKETTENPPPTDKAPSQTETQSSAPTETTENPLPTETQPNPILAPTETTPSNPPTETPPDDVVIVTSTSTITTTITPAAVETPGAEKRSFTKIYKRKNNKLQPRAFDQSTTELLVPNSLGTMTNVEFQPRNDNSEVNQVVTLQFDGIVDKLDGTGGNELPDGRYRLFLAALKPFGNPEKKEDWETFTSSIIEIKRD